MLVQNIYLCWFFFNFTTFFKIIFFLLFQIVIIRFRSWSQVIPYSCWYGACYLTKMQLVLDAVNILEKKIAVYFKKN